jgi:hypothetical protein
MVASRQGTGFVNLNTWLGLNQGSAQNMARGIEDAVADEAVRYQQALQGARDEMEAGIAKNGVPDASGVTGLTSQQAQQYGAQKWNGPEGYSPEAMGRLTTAAYTAQNAARATDTNEGRQTLLTRKFGPTSWGGGALDAALAGAGGGAALERTRGAFGKLADNLGVVAQHGKNRASAAKSDFEKKTKAYADMVPGLQQQEQQKAQQADAALLSERQRELDAEARQNRNNRNGRPGAGYGVYP